MDEATVHQEQKYKNSSLSKLFLDFCELALNSDFQGAKNVSSTFRHLCEQIALTATYDLGYPPMFEGELKKVVAWMDTTTSMKIYNHSQREQYEHFLRKAFDWAWKKPQGDKA